MSTLLICAILWIHDGDQVRCATGETVRLAGVDAGELDGTCHDECPRLGARAGRDELARAVDGVVDEARSIRSAGDVSRERLWLANRPTITFTIYGRSGKRLVGENYALRCDLLRVGAVVRWASYERRYGLRSCP